MTCTKCQHGQAKRFGCYGKRRIQRYRCRACKATFSEPRLKPLGNHYTDPATVAQILSFMVEGMSVRAISRLTGVHKGTIVALLLTVGRNCRAVFDRTVRNVRPTLVQADELWTFVHTKERRLFSGDPKEWGDNYVWMALESKTKLVLVLPHREARRGQCL